MLGSTPPAAIVTPPSNLLSSSSFRTANWMWRGTIRVFLLSRAAFPASSRTSAARYSSTAACKRACCSDVQFLCASFQNCSISNTYSPHGVKTYQVYRRTSTNTTGKLALFQVASNSAHRELQTSFARPADCLLAGCSAFTTS